MYFEFNCCLLFLLRSIPTIWDRLPLSYIFLTHTSSLHITLNHIQPLLRSSSSTFKIHFYNHSYRFRIFSPHNITKPPKSIIFYILYDLQFYASSYIFISYPILSCYPTHSSKHSHLRYIYSLFYFLGTEPYNIVSLTTLI